MNPLQEACSNLNEAFTELEESLSPDVYKILSEHIALVIKSSEHSVRMDHEFAKFFNAVDNIRDRYYTPGGGNQTPAPEPLATPRRVNAADLMRATGQNLLFGVNDGINTGTLMF